VNILKLWSRAGTADVLTSVTFSSSLTLSWEFAKPNGNIRIIVIVIVVVVIIIIVIAIIIIIIIIIIMDC
jgi:hypothetical protein